MTPEEKAQKIAKAMRKQSSEVKEKWETLNAVTSSWQKQVDKALEKLRDLQGAMDDLDADLKEAEAVRNGWKPVGDLLIDSLQDHIEKTMVSIPAVNKAGALHQQTHTWGAGVNNRRGCPPGAETRGSSPRLLPPWLGSAPSPSLDPVNSPNPAVRPLIPSQVHWGFGN